MKLPKIFHSKVFLGFVVVALLLGIGIEYKQYRDRKLIDQEIAALQAEENRLLESNRQLEQSISFLSSPEYQEKLARMQLNLKKEGEIVVNFPSQSEGAAVSQNNSNSRSNITKWWEYIFIN